MEMSAGVFYAPAAAGAIGGSREGPHRGCPRRKAKGHIQVRVRVSPLSRDSSLFK